MEIKQRPGVGHAWGAVGTRGREEATPPCLQFLHCGCKACARLGRQPGCHKRLWHVVGPRLPSLHALPSRCQELPRPACALAACRTASQRC